MKLMHLNLTTTDAVASAEFLCTYFGLRNEGGNKAFVLLRDEAGMVITLMKAKTVKYPETFHIGFYPETEGEVDALHARLTEDGFPVPAPERHHGYPYMSRHRAGSRSKSLRKTGVRRASKTFRDRDGTQRPVVARCIMRSASATRFSCPPG